MTDSTQDAYSQRLSDKLSRIILQMERTGDWRLAESEARTIKDASQWLAALRGPIEPVEAVAWQMRTRFDDSDVWGEWESTSRERCERIQRSGKVGMYPAEARPLYASPPTPQAETRRALEEALSGLQYIAPAIPVLRTMFMTADLKLGAVKAEEMDASNKEAIEKLKAVLAAMSKTASICRNCDFPEGVPFAFHDEPGEHDPCYVVMPGGSMLPLNHHAGEGVDIARAKFIVDACNAALSTSPAPAEDVRASVIGGPNVFFQGEAHVDSAAFQNTDGAEAVAVLAAVRHCANSWDGAARLLGNVRASDIARACNEAIQALLPKTPIHRTPEDGPSPDYPSIELNPTAADTLKSLLGILDGLDEYQKRPGNGDYGVEYICCRGEIFSKSDRAAIESARASLVTAPAEDVRAAEDMRNALTAARQKLQLYRQEHCGVYVGGVEFTALMKQIDRALARPDPKHTGKVA